MQHPDEGTIHTWLDGELSVEDAAALEAHVSDCGECMAVVAEARGLVAASSRIVSSLDIVPRGVIPIAKPAHRAWYATTQFRAAAALLLVAGTSVVLARSGGKSSNGVLADKALPVTTAEDVSAPTLQSAPMAGSIPPQAHTSKQLNTPPSEASVTAAPKPSAPVVRSGAVATADRAANRPVDEVAERRDTRDAAESAIGAMKASPLRSLMPGVAATGLAVATESDAELKIVRVDTSGIVKKTVITVPAGVEVTLTEMEPENFAPPAARMSAKAMTLQQRQTAAAAPVRAPTATAMPAPASDLDLSKSTVIHTISWIDSASGKKYTLSGPLPVDQLEALKPKVLKVKR